MKINWLAVIVCVVVGMGLGFLWYGMLFMNQWMAGNGITMNGDSMLKNGNPMDMSNMPMIVNAITMVVSALIMNWLVQKTNSTNLMEGLTVGAVVGLLIVMGIFVGNMFAGNPMSLSMVDGSYSFIIYTAMGAILGAWQKK